MPAGFAFVRRMHMNRKALAAGDVNRKALAAGDVNRKALAAGDVSRIVLGAAGFARACLPFRCGNTGITSDTKTTSNALESTCILLLAAPAASGLLI